VTTVPLTSDQKKLLEVTKPKSSRNKRVQSPKGAQPWNKKKFTQLESQQNEITRDNGQDMPRVRYRKRTVRAVFRGRRPRVPLRRNLRPRRPKRTMMRVKPMGTGTTRSFYKQPVRYKSFRRKIMTLSPRQTQMYTTGQRVTWSYREQGYYEFMMATKPDMLTILNNIPSFSDLTTMFVKNCIVERYISNQSNANAYIKIYEIEYKRSTQTSPSGLINAGLTDLAAGATVTTYGVTPNMGWPAWNPFIRIKRMYNVELGAGRTHKHVSAYEFNKEWNQEIYAESASTDNLSGWTRGVFILAHGEPVNDVTTKTKVVPSSGAIDLVTKQVWNYYYGTPSKPALEYFTNLPTGTITENIMEADTDAPSVVEVA